MSYKNWKQVLGVFKLWKLSYDGIFVNTHMWGAHGQSIVTLGATFHSHSTNGSNELQSLHTK